MSHFGAEGDRHRKESLVYGRAVALVEARRRSPAHVASVSITVKFRTCCQLSLCSREAYPPAGITPFAAMKKFVQKSRI